MILYQSLKNIQSMHAKRLNFITFLMKYYEFQRVRKLWPKKETIWRPNFKVFTNKVSIVDLSCHPWKGRGVNNIFCNRKGPIWEMGTKWSMTPTYSLFRLFWSLNLFGNHLQPLPFLWLMVNLSVHNIPTPTLTTI